MACCTKPSDGGPTVVCQGGLLFFCFCLVFATMNFLPGDGLVQIKMNAIVNHRAACPDLQEASRGGNGG